MQRRDFLLSAAAAGAAAGLSAGAAEAAHPAALRLGRRILAEASADDRAMLRSWSAGLWPAGQRPALSALADRIADEFRSDVTWRVRGVTLSRTEAAWLADAAGEAGA